MAASLALVLGGVRSGKSAFAEKLVLELDQPVLYLATGVATDADMVERIARHRQRRPANWITIEEPLHLAKALEFALAAADHSRAVLIDSLDVWASNFLLAHEEEPSPAVEASALSAVDRLLSVCRGSNAAISLVSSEVGLSPVAPYPLGRRFQDLLGLVNQRVPAAANRVYLVVAGSPMRIKGMAAQ